jgi:multidrug resistance efflux pump
MPDETVSVPKSTGAQRLKRWLAPATILLMSAGIVILITGNWNRWVGDHTWQTTDDAYVRADLTPLSTKVAGLVATVAVSDYQPIRAGDLLVQLRDDDFRAQVQQAEAAVRSSEDALLNNQRQKELRDARIAQADAGIGSAEADIAASQGWNRGGEIRDRLRTRRDRRSQSGCGAHKIGPAPAGSAVRGRVCETAKAGASSSR